VFFRCALTLAPEKDFFIRKSIGWASSAQVFSSHVGALMGW
jgi:3-methyladenine DNA glycosylase AlkD